MKVIRTIITFCAATALTAGTASAQSQSSGQQDTGSAQSSSGGQQQSSAQQSSSGGQSSALQQAQAQEFFRASDIKGKNVQTANGQKVGSIKDIVFNQQGQVFGLVDIGNSKWAVVPWQAFSPQSAKGNQNLTLNTTQQALQSGPIVSQNQWGALDNPSFVQGVYSYYHLQQPTAVGGGSAPSGMSQGQDSSQQQSQPSQQQQSQPQSQR